MQKRVSIVHVATSYMYVLFVGSCLLWWRDIFSQSCGVKLLILQRSFVASVNVSWISQSRQVAIEMSARADEGQPRHATYIPCA
jgi:hypothetical protein